MEFHEKLQTLRTGARLTQEELAEQLYVSRTAISKWESGRGYPSIASLQAIAQYFHLTVDELISGDELLTLAERDGRERDKGWVALSCGISDCLALPLLFLPVFRGGAGAAVSLFAMAGGGWLKGLLLAVVALTAANGVCTVAISRLDEPLWKKHRVATGMALSVVGTLLFVLTRQPYAGALSLCLLVAKGLVLIKGK